MAALLAPFFFLVCAHGGGAMACVVCCADVLDEYLVVRCGSCGVAHVHVECAIKHAEGTVIRQVQNTSALRAQREALLRWPRKFYATEHVPCPAGRCSRHQGA
jgi:hypothetical protein